jgi:hypothetical protein
MSKTKPIATFRVYPGSRHSRIYFNVFIWRTFKELRAQWTKDHSPAPGLLMAWCDGGRVIKSNGKWNYINELGRVHFCIKNIGGGIVAHEMTHAAFRWIDRKRMQFQRVVSTEPFTLTKSSEETHCLAVERMVRQFFQYIYGHGIAKPGDKVAHPI